MFTLSCLESLAVLRLQGRLLIDAPFVPIIRLIANYPSPSLLLPVMSHPNFAFVFNAALETYK
jgi:hypothetical protein